MGAGGHGTVHWTELNTWDVEKAKAFYGALCGWRFSDMPMADGSVYTIAHAGDAMACGMMSLAGPEMEGVPENWMSYFEHEDVDAAARSTEAQGGAVLKAPFDVPGVGRILIIRDANGGVVGLITPSAPDEASTAGS